MLEKLKIGFILAVFCSVAAGSLQFVYSVTKPVIKENIRIAAIKKRQEVQPDAVRFEEKKIDGKTVWIGISKDNREVGAVIELSPKGYSGKIRATMGISNEGAVTALAINKLDQSETPGLGVKITLPVFKEQFRGKQGDSLKLKKDGGEIDGITAATISSRAVANGVNDGWQWYKDNKDKIK